MAESQLGLGKEEDVNRWIFLTEWKQKWDRIEDIHPQLRVSNDKEISKKWSELGVISGEFNINTKIATVLLAYSDTLWNLKCHCKQKNFFVLLLLNLFLT